MHVVECSGCGITFECKHKRRFCEPRCRRSIQNAKYKSGNKEGPPLPPVGTLRQCLICEKAFTVRRNRHLKYCSKQCQDKAYAHSPNKRAFRAARRRKESAQLFDPFEVFWRDGWKCKSCGVSTPERLRGTKHDRAPELDHIVPLSMGGEHTKQNTQLLCKKCNRLKSSGKLFDQTLLFG